MIDTNAETRAPNGAASPFAELGVDSALVRALEREGYENPTPIQQQAIPAVLAGRDVLATAQTGTGKTAAFLLPTLQRLAARKRDGRVRALVLTPTRELAAQIGERAEAYGKHTGIRHTVIFGGVGQRPQEETLRRGVDLLIATPGRLLDLMNQGHAKLDSVEFFVLDEADRMLDMGFIHDVRRVVRALPVERQTLFFSATMPRDIVELAAAILRDPARVAVEPQVTSAVTVDQSLYFVEKARKREMLEEILRKAEAGGLVRAIVFTRTKHGANRLSEQHEKSGFSAAAIHGNKSQNARTRALEGFRSGSIHVLVATDLAARGIDVDGVTHVVNYELPDVAESYVHRIGRTGRAGASGTAIAFCDVHEERDELMQIERLLGHPIPSPHERPAGLDRGGGGSRPAHQRPQQRPAHHQRSQPQRPQAQRPQQERSHERPQQARSAERPQQERSQERPPQRPSQERPQQRSQAPQQARHDRPRMHDDRPAQRTSVTAPRHGGGTDEVRLPRASGAPADGPLVASQAPRDGGWTRRAPKRF